MTRLVIIPHQQIQKAATNVCELMRTLRGQEELYDQHGDEHTENSLVREEDAI